MVNRPRRSWASETLVHALQVFGRKELLVLGVRSENEVDQSRDDILVRALRLAVLELARLVVRVPAPAATLAAAAAPAPATAAAAVTRVAHQPASSAFAFAPLFPDRLGALDIVQVTAEDWETPGAVRRNRVAVVVVAHAEGRGPGSHR